MSDVQKLKDCIIEYRKANKELDEQLTKIEDDSRQARQDVEDKQSRQG